MSARRRVWLKLEAVLPDVPSSSSRTARFEPKRMLSMNKHEKAFYDRLPSGLSHREKLAFMSMLGPKFEQLPPRQRTKFLKQAYADKQSQFIVRHKGKLVSVPQHNVFVALRRLGIEIQAGLTLLK